MMLTGWIHIFNYRLTKTITMNILAVLSLGVMQQGIHYVMEF